MKQTENPNDLLTIAEAARIFRVDGTTVRRWINLGAMDAIILPHPRDRRAYRVKRATIDAILSTSQSHHEHQK